MTSTTPPVERLGLLDQITLDKGSHSSFDEGHCAMEVVAWLAGEGFTDAPECASPVLRTFTISLNDQWDSVQRQKLVPFLPRMVGTAGDGKDEARSFMGCRSGCRSGCPPTHRRTPPSLRARPTRLHDRRRGDPMSRLVMADTYVTLLDDNGYPVTVTDLATGDTVFDYDAPRSPLRRLAGWGSVLAAGLLVWASVFAAGWWLL